MKKYFLVVLVLFISTFLVFNFNVSANNYSASFFSFFRNIISLFRFRTELKSSPAPSLKIIRYTPTPSQTPKRVLKQSSTQSPTQVPKQIFKKETVPGNQPTPTLTPTSTLIKTNIITPAPILSVQATPISTPSASSGQAGSPQATLVSTSSPQATPSISPVKVADIKNLLAYWNFDEGSGITLNDSSSSGINGRIWNVVGTGAWLDEGKIGKALELDGYDDYIHFESLPVVNLGAENQSYSISLWIKRNGSPPYEGGIINKNDGVGKYPFAVTIQKDGKVAFHLYDGTTVAKIISDPIADNQWKHIVAVKDSINKQLKLYINNKALPEVEDTTKGSLKNDDYIYIGRYPFGDNSFYHDSFVIDEARIYERALTDAEVKALYDAGNPKVSILNFLRSLILKVFSF